MWDQHAKLTDSQIRHFRLTLWPQTVRDFRRCRVHFDLAESSGAVKRLASGRPEFTGLNPARLNLVLTNSIPIAWDHGRGTCGVTLRYEGYHLCVIALDYAHAHQVPYVSVNTVIHELLHALLLDIFEQRPAGASGEARELRVDYYATRLWLFHDGSAIRESSETYLRRLQADLTLWQRTAL